MFSIDTHQGIIIGKILTEIAKAVTNLPIACHCSQGFAPKVPAAKTSNLLLNYAKRTLPPPKPIRKNPILHLWR